MRELQLGVQDRRWVAGTTVPVDVRVAAPDDFRSVTLSLILQERMKGSARALGSIEPHVLARVPITDMSARVDVVVPPDLPAAYEGSIAAWSYRLQLTGDRPGPDKEEVVEIEIVPISTTSRSALGDRRTSPALRRAPFTRRHRDKGGWPDVVIALASICASLGLFWIAIWGPAAFDATEQSTNNMRITGSFGGLLFALVAFFLSIQAVSFLRNRDSPQPSFNIPQPVVEPGMDLVIGVDDAGRSGLQIVLRRHELAMGASGVADGPKHGSVVKLLDERVFPVVDSTVRIPTSTDGVRGFAGRSVAMHWTVGLLNHKNHELCPFQAVDIHA